jgi:putative ABC transport system permease protein
MDLSNINDASPNSNPALDYIKKGESDGKITPLGFNGVFTKRTNGSSVLNCGQYLYAPSGIYPGNDALDSDVVKNVLKQSANLEIANIVSGLIKTDVGQRIHNAFLTWQNNRGNDTFNAMISDSNINDFTNKLKEIYGTTSVVSLVSGATDRNSTHLIFTNLSNTITEVETAVLGIIGLMVVIIVMLITVMLINDSKKLAAILKALGYSDNENAQSFLAIYVPVIVIGLLLAMPLSFAIIYTFQAVIFTGAGILLPATVK